MMSAGFYPLTVYMTAGLLAVVSIAWCWTYMSDRKNFTERLHVSESRTKASENRVALLKDQLAAAQSDIGLLRERMENERLAKTAEVSELRQNLHRSALLMAGYALGIGILFGGAVSWICTGARAEARHLQRVMTLEVDTRVVQTQKGILETELLSWKKENKDLRDALRTALEDKAVAFAKLDVILSSFNLEKLGRGFALDQKKLIDEWSQHERVPASEPPVSLSGMLSASR